MKAQNVPHFILIDDLPMNNMLCSLYILKIFPKADIQTFTDPREGLEYIRTKNTGTGVHETIVFLDLKMPMLTGWDVLEKIAGFPGDAITGFKIYILTSSTNSRDKERAEGNPLVTGYIEKPVTDIELRVLFPNA